MSLRFEALIDGLPDVLRERTRVFSARSIADSSEFVLYWMRTAVRGDENPALDVGIHLANQLHLPVLVYHALSERYPYASDRHHTFILQGARDVQAEIADRGVTYVFHLERPGHRGPHLRNLATRAACLITEEMPVDPLRRWTAAVRRSSNASVALVDTACVVPMRIVGRAFERAFAYRKATKQLYAERVTRPAPCTIVAEHSQRAFATALPFEPVELQQAVLSELVSACQIDHAVGPVSHTVGGSCAGYVRWGAFVADGIERYAKRRNNPMMDGVSRMSPYLHYGMVSPFRLARETSALSGDGAEKFLEELLIWRELAYNFCFYRPEHGTMAALPSWAIETLERHEADPRPAIPSWETLARGQTGDLLWDAAQRGLLMHGQIHNNVRMTWGKSLLQWRTKAKHALATMIDLNHRYALDGRDPASYGGILWCLGQFDRPFPPERPILGTVRERTTTEHVKRLEPHAYMKKATQPVRAPMPHVAVLGAGLSGLTCARTLADHGFNVTVFEKSRGLGGRMATRRAESDLRFDHGAQYFTVRDERFRRYVDSWIQDNIVQMWQGRIVEIHDGEITQEKGNVPRYVAVPTMNAICKHLGVQLDVRVQTRVGRLTRSASGWNLIDDQDSDLGSFDGVLLSAPAGQTADLLQDVPGLAGMAAKARGVSMHGCCAVMLATDTALPLPYDGAFVQDSPLSWIARNSSKPARVSRPETWVLHTSPEWSEQHVEDSLTTVTDRLTDAFWQATGLPPGRFAYTKVHRWHYALPAQPLADTCLFDRDLQVGACGDWCGGPRVEGAFLSGMAAAGKFLGLLTDATSPIVPQENQQQELF